MDIDELKTALKHLNDAAYALQDQGRKTISIHMAVTGLALELDDLIDELSFDMMDDEDGLEYDESQQDDD